MNSIPPKFAKKPMRAVRRRTPARAETVHANMPLAKTRQRIAGRAFTVGMPREASVKGKFQTDECVCA